MVDRLDVAGIAALVGEATRARMLMALMDGRALTATELAFEGGVTASTTSSHLSRLSSAGLVLLARQGRHRYYRIATPQIATMLEGLMGVASDRGGPIEVSPREAELRRARVCYDHLAGEAGVRLLERLRQRRLVAGQADAPELTSAGEQWALALGIDLPALQARRRPLYRACLDWSERRMHLAGAFGGALLERLLALRFVRREPGTRALAISPRGASFLIDLETSGHGSR